MIVALILGGIAQTVVAVVCAVWADDQPAAHPSDLADVIDQLVPERHANLIIWPSTRAGPGVDHTSVYPHLAGDMPLLSGCTPCRVRAGWPLRSFSGESRSREDHAGLIVRSVPITYARQPFCGTCLIPVRPRWPQLVTNTLIYASPLLPLIMARTIRDARRRRSGRCLACGHPLGPPPTPCR